MLISLFFFGFLRLSVPEPPEHFVESVKCDPKAPPFTVRLTLTSAFTTRFCAAPGELFGASGPPGGPLGIRVLRDPVVEAVLPGPPVELFGRKFNATVTVQGQVPGRTETLRLRPVEHPGELVIEFYRSGRDKAGTAQEALEAFKTHLLKLEITP